MEESIEDLQQLFLRIGIATSQNELVNELMAEGAGTSAQLRERWRHERRK
jgi:hypothetical protein